MSASSLSRVRREIEHLCEAGLDWVELSSAVGRQIKKVAPYDGACWHTMDPATLLLTGNAIEDIPDGGLPTLAACEYGHEDVNKWGFLARQPSTVGRLGAATQGQPELSNRYRTLLRPVGFEREMRASFVDAGGCWGSAGFYREAGRPDFTEEDESFLRSVTRILGLGYRRALVIDLLENEQPSEGPGIIVVDAQDEIEAISPPAEAWLSQLPRETPTDDALPMPILSLCAQVRAFLRGGGSETAVSLRVRTPGGEWLLVRATPLQGSDDSRIGLTIEPAGPPELAQLLMSGHGLSQREQEVAYAVLRGASTKEIADELFISPYTVQDHLKAIFDKLNVRSRREMVSRIYSEHYLPLVAQGRAPNGSGWFSSRTKPTSISA